MPRDRRLEYYPDYALATLQAIGRALGERADVRAVISLGNRSAVESAGSLAPNVTVETYVDQWRLLADADLFITHVGLKSVHEAVFHRVPIISHPLFGDQPHLARRCQDLGLAIPLTEELRGRVEKADGDRTLHRSCARRASLRERMETACGWLTREIEGRSAGVDRMLALASR